MKRLKRIIVTGGIFLLGFIVVTFAGMEYTSRPEFCRTCHYMEPFYVGWEMSAHSNVDCVTCHFEPGLAGTIRGKAEGLVQVGKYLTQSYRKSKPWAEIEDASCLRSGCHQQRLLTGPIPFKGVWFDHSPHLTDLRRDRQLRCTSCHSQIVQGDHITVTTSTCYTCHFKGLPGEERTASCTLCHLPTTLTARLAETDHDVRFDHTEVLERNYDCQQCHTNTIVGDGAVYRESCFNCHFEPERLNRFDDTELLHRTHITERKIECQQCHLTIQHKVQHVAALTGEDCQSCHPDRHSAQINLFTGRVGDGAPHPSPMQAAGLTCRGCHIFHGESDNGDSETLTAGGQSCEHCHGSGFGELLDKWNVSSTNQLAKVEAAFASARELVAGHGVPEEARTFAETLASVEQKIDLVRKGKSAHNMTLSHQLLSEVYGEIRGLMVSMGATSALPPLPNADNLVPSQCASCHLGVENLNPQVYGLNFEHGRHLPNGVTCSKCHSNLRIHGELLLTQSDCSSCHHSSEAADCSRCHADQAELLAGTAQEFPGEPDFMWMEEESCVQCHPITGATPLRDPQVCADCHDEDYPLMVADWRSEIEELLVRLESQGLTEPRKWLENEGSLGGHNPQTVLDNLNRLGLSLIDANP